MTPAKHTVSRPVESSHDDQEMALCVLAREQNALGEADAAIHRIKRKKPKRSSTPGHHPAKR